MSSTEEKSPLSLLPPVIPPTTRTNFIRNWWRRSDATSSIAEARLLHRVYAVNPLRNPIPLLARKVTVPLKGQVNSTINTLMISAAKDQDEPYLFLDDNHQKMAVKDNYQMDNKANNLVMCHGYGAGLGFFYRNFYALGQMPGWRVFALDWLGMGRSSRPKWTITKSSKQSWDAIVDEVEEHFVQSLEDWRQKVGLDKMTLLGHSMGGYFATCYALKYPERVEKLILVSPAGIPEQPGLVQAAPNESPQDSLEKQATELGATMQAVAASAGNAARLGDGSNIEPVSAPPAPITPSGRKIPAWAKYLWDRNITPMSIVRYSGPFGASLVHGYTSRRFAHLDLEERHDLYDYLYNITSASGSGEYMLAAVLAPGAHARKPLYHRLKGLKMPTIFIYGEHDWMDYKAAKSASKFMAVQTKVIRIANGGHHMYLDNPEEFNEAVVQELSKENKNE